MATYKFICISLWFGFIQFLKIHGANAWALNLIWTIIWFLFFVNSSFRQFLVMDLRLANDKWFFIFLEYIIIWTIGLQLLTLSTFVSNQPT